MAEPKAPKTEPARSAPQSDARLPETGTVGQAGGEKPKEKVDEPVKAQEAPKTPPQEEVGADEDLPF